MKQFHSIFWSFCLGTMLLLGCKEDPPPLAEVDFSQGVWILNEGTFNWGNASVSFLDGDGKMTQNVFRDHNENLPLGDVAQSMSRYGNTVDIVVNNSGKVVRVNANTLKVEKQLEGLVSPRYVLPLGNDKAYLSDLYGNHIKIFDQASLTVTGEIPTTAWTEVMILHNGDVFATLMGGDQVLVIDPVTDQVIDSIQVGREPNSLVIDRDGIMWVLCSGGVNEEKPELVRVDVDSRMVDGRFEFPSLASSPNRLAIDTDGETLYFIDGGIYAMDVAANVLPSAPLIAADQHNFYNFKLQGGFLWATDAVDFVQSGSLLKYQLPGGALVETHLTGTIPNEILFFP